MHLDALGEQEGITTKKSKQEEEIKHGAEINEIETKPTRKRVNANKIDKQLAKLTKRLKEKVQINKIRGENRIVTDSEEIQRP